MDRNEPIPIVEDASSQEVTIPIAKSSFEGFRRQNANYWHAITRPGCGCLLTHQRRRPNGSSRLIQFHLAEPDNGPSGLFILAFAFLALRSVGCGDLDTIGALGEVGARLASGNTGVRTRSRFASNSGAVLSRQGCLLRLNVGRRRPATSNGFTSTMTEQVAAESNTRICQRCAGRSANLLTRLRYRTKQIAVAGLPADVSWQPCVGVAALAFAIFGRMAAIARCRTAAQTPHAPSLWLRRRRSLPRRWRRPPRSRSARE